MAAQIWLAPVGSGKTERVLAELSQTLRDSPFASVWLLVSGKRQEDAFRQRLIDSDTGRRVYFNVEFFNAYELYHRLLSMAGQPPLLLDDNARYNLLRSIIDELHQAGQLSVFGAIAQTTGFLRIAADFIYELKQNLVEDVAFETAALSDKDRDLALIYRSYQDTLRRHELVDREGAGWLALDLLQRKDHLHIGSDVDLLLVDGFDQFTPLQANLLMLVAARARDAIITLSTVPGSEDSLGRRFADALAQLQAYQRGPVEIVNLDMTSSQRPAVLQHVMDNLFQAQAQPGTGAGHVRLIEAPDPAQESAALLREVKQMLLRGAAKPDDILIALRDWPRYAGHLSSQGSDYQLPLALHEGQPLSQNPAVVTILNLLRLPELQFRRRDLLDVLRSPYIDAPGLGPEQVAQLSAISERFLVTGGRQQWLNAVARAAQSSSSDDGEIETALLDTEQQRQLYDALSDFFVAVTAPSEGSISDFVHWLSDLIGPDTDLDPDDIQPGTAAYHLNIPEQLALAGSAAIANRDRSALAEFMQILRSLIRADSLLSALDAAVSRPAERFLRQLRIAVDQAQIQRSPSRTGRVLVTTVANARGLPHRHVFIPGLSEGIFPAPQSEDPLYLDSERAALRDAGILLQSLADRANDEGLFYEIIGLAQETLTLSRPTVQDGAPWVPSHLWRALNAVLSDADHLRQTIRSGDIATLDQAASMQDYMLALADALSESRREAANARAWILQSQGERWQRIERARLIELRRLSSRNHHDSHTGRLFEPTLIAEAAAALGPERLWSASQLNDYGYCGFRFFAKRLLGLDTLETPESGLDVTQLGTINHAILEAAYTEMQRRGLEIAPENLDAALEIVDAVATSILDDAPQVYGFAANSMWTQEQGVLKRRIEALVKLDFSGDGPVSKLLPGPRRPLLFEAAFGDEIRVPLDINGHTEALRVRGFIDRIDISADQVAVIDYKTGSTGIPTSDMREGRNFQMMLYLFAAQQLLDSSQSVAGGLFWHIRNQKASGLIQLNDEGQADMESALDHIGRYIAAGRQGDFAVQPRKMIAGRCVHYCDFAQLCRANSISQYKPEDEA